MTHASIALLVLLSALALPAYADSSIDPAMLQARDAEVMRARNEMHQGRERISDQHRGMRVERRDFRESARERERRQVREEERQMRRQPYNY